MGWVIVGLLGFMIVFLFIFDFHSIRMVMHIKRKDYQGAIRIAEKIPQERRSIYVVINHIGAYYHSGRLDKARELFDIADKRKDYKPVVKRDIEVWRRALYP